MYSSVLQIGRQLSVGATCGRGVHFMTQLQDVFERSGGPVAAPCAC
jgi:hypothetical protein